MTERRQKADICGFESSQQLLEGLAWFLEHTFICASYYNNLSSRFIYLRLKFMTKYLPN